MRKILILILFALVAGCTTPIQIKSEPQGAQVYHEGTFIGVTPTTLQASNWASSTSVKVMKEGYQAEQKMINTTYDGWSGQLNWPTMEFFRLARKRKE